MFIGWLVYAKKGTWSSHGTMSSMSTGATNEMELIEYLEKQAAKFGHEGDFDELTIKEIERW